MLEEKHEYTKKKKVNFSTLKGHGHDPQIKLKIFKLYFSIYNDFNA